MCSRFAILIACMHNSLKKIANFLTLGTTSHFLLIAVCSFIHSFSHPIFLCGQPRGKNPIGGLEIPHCQQAHVVLFRVKNMAFFRPNCENLSVFRSGLAASILFGVFRAFLKIWPNFDLICLWYHILQFYAIQISPCALSRKHFSSW